MENLENTEEIVPVSDLIVETSTVSEPIEKVVAKPTKSSTTTKLSNPPLSNLVKEGDVITLTKDLTYKGNTYYKATQGTVKSIYEPGSYAHNKFALPLGIKDKALYIAVGDNPFQGFVISFTSDFYN